MENYAGIFETGDALRNPMHEFIVFLNACEIEAVEDLQLERYVKNLRTTFNKMYLTVEQIIKHQEMGLNYEKHPLLQVQPIEYFYLKVSTIWDLSYLIAEKLIYKGKAPAGKEKFKKLNERFSKYKGDLQFLRLDWYERLNAIRNRIVHGEINLMPFYVDGELLFNVYNKDVDSILENSAIYTMECGLKASAERYFVYNLGLIYHYLCDFFTFIKYELQDEMTIKHQMNDAFYYPVKFQEYWHFPGLDDYNKKAVAQNNLPLTTVRDYFVVSRRDVKTFYGERGTEDYRNNMVSSVVKKHRIPETWLNDRTLRLSLQSADDRFTGFAKEIIARELGMISSEGNREKMEVTISFV